MILLPSEKGFGLQESKRKVTRVSLVKMVENLPSISSPLNHCHAE